MVSYSARSSERNMQVGEHQYQKFTGSQGRRIHELGEVTQVIEEKGEE